MREIISSAEFDERNNFTGGQFAYYIYGMDAVELESIISDSEIMISDVMVKGSISNGKESTIELQVENTKSTTHHLRSGGLETSPD